MTDTDKTLKGLLSEDKPTLVVFYRADCAKKEEQGKVLDDLASDFRDRANIYRIDGTANQDLMKEYKVGAYPTFILFTDGQEAWRDTGHKPYSELADMIRRFI